jgi:hypothetical protein
LLSKLWLILIFVFVFAGLSQQLVALGPFGLGLMAGEPSGIVAKLWFSDFLSLDGAFAWSFAEGGFFYTHVDVQYNIFNILENQNIRFPFYAGIGGRVRFGGREIDDSILGIRFPIGVNFIFRQFPIDMFLEIAPGIDLIPATDFFLSGGLGIRYYF